MSEAGKPVAIIMGSQSDWATMRHAAEALKALEIGFDALIVSAHRTPERLYEFAKGACEAGFKVDYRGCRRGCAPARDDCRDDQRCRCSASRSRSKALSGQDSLLSIVQMPAGIPVGTLAIGRPARSTLPCWPQPSSLCGTQAWLNGSKHYRRPADRVVLPNVPTDDACMLNPGDDDRHSRRRPTRAHARACGGANSGSICHISVPNRTVRPSMWRQAIRSPPMSDETALAEFAGAVVGRHL